MGEPAHSAVDDEHRRTFIRALLTEEFGDAIGNESEFTRIASEVWRVLGQDKETRQLLDQAIEQLHADD
jgi:uncharacterized membrane protein YebE (DUF533 family)